MQTAGDECWPEDLRWIREKTPVKFGTPRFLVIVDKEVVLNTTGPSNWAGKAMPLIKTLLAQKTS